MYIPHVSVLSDLTDVL